MCSESERLMPDPADDADPYPDVKAWEPSWHRPRGRGVLRRTIAVQKTPVSCGGTGEASVVESGDAQAHGVSLEFPVIQWDIPSRHSLKVCRSRPFGSAEATNLVPQSAFLKKRIATQVVTQCTISPRVHISGPDMQKSDFFSTHTRSSSAPLPVGSVAGFAGGAGDLRSEHSGFQHTASGPLTGERLDGFGSRWLQSLPVAVRPLITAKRHPHIVNKFAILWGDDEAVNAYFDDLLISSRPGRRGFAMEVLDELVDLQRAVQEKRRF